MSRSVAPGAPPPFDDRASEADIAACFRLILGRNPNPEEWRGHSSRAGETLDAVVGSYVNSLEFTRRGLQAAPTAALETREMAGYKILASPEDLAVGRHVLYGSYEPEVAAVFHDLLRPGMAVIDVGANIGFFTMLAASLVGAAGLVLALEPNPRNARLAEASRRLNGFTQVSVVQVAAGRAAGMLAINTSFSNGTTSALDGSVTDVETVGCLTIDQMAPRCRIDLIKLDVEGAEYNALIGASETIRRDRPILVFEFGPAQLPGISGVEGEELLQWVVGQGYELEVIRKEGAPETTERNCAAVMQAYRAAGSDHIDVLARPVGRLGRVRGMLGRAWHLLA